MAAARIVLILVALPGCEPGGPGRDDGFPAAHPFTRNDSSGILISVTSGESARSSMGWEVEPLADIVIGAGESPSDDLFRVRGMRGLPGEGLVLVDGGSREIRFFDAQGGFVGRAGGRGEGPGEFQDPVLVPWPGADSLLFFDTRLPRLQVFSMDGQHRRTTRHVKGWPHGRVPPVGVVAHRALFISRGYVGGEAALRRGGLIQTEENLFWYDLETGEKIKLESVVTDASFKTNRGTSAIPFRPTAAAAVAKDRALSTDGRLAEVREYDVEGRLRRILRVDEPRRPITPAMIEGKIDLEASKFPPVSPASRRSYWASEFAQMPIPDSLPVFRSLRVDEVGWLWAEVYEWDPSLAKQWMVFDPEGRSHGTVRTPQGLRIEWIGEDAILGVWLDELGVEQVRRHRLRRGPVAVGGV